MLVTPLLSTVSEPRRPVKACVTSVPRELPPRETDDTVSLKAKGSIVVIPALVRRSVLLRKPANALVRRTRSWSLDREMPLEHIVHPANAPGKIFVMPG